MSSQAAPRRPRAVTVRRGALGVLGAAQILLAAAQVTTLASAPHPGHGAMDAASMDHLWHESASWNAAVGAGLLWVAARRQRTAGVLPILSAFVAVLALLSVADVAAGRVQWPRLASHAVVVLAVAVAAMINRVDRQPRTPRGEGSRWQLPLDNQPPPPQARLRLLPRDGTALHAVRNRLGVPSWRPSMGGTNRDRRTTTIRGVIASRAASRRARTIVMRGWTRTGVLAGGAVAALLLTAGPASAHVEVSADKAQAGATDSVLTFVAESESTTAGITALRVVLPAGIKPADVTWVSGPTGWALKTAADGYTVSGPAVPAGKDAEYAVRVRQLPTDIRQLVFKTLQTYSDDHVDRWIEEPNSGGAADNPAPVLTVAAAPAGAATSPSAAPTPSASAPATDASSAATPAPAADEQDAGTPAVVWLLVIAAGAAAVGGLWWALRRRRA
ncbi:DUF1775 domain-containing protein [Micromonospora yasonensis]|uniref:DUF1775 domain-containing protein n=1 Tax=Micromonospora yasonensis TaxID=1128667 RepID=UPI00222F5717|nr:DUF1775 domain-containing protein [Micromonospora yasonensis]MCW3845003.1 DUF1775 domain-containing protein [Micromonospora yasonensis]